jgi:chromosome segregation ATPase
LAQSKKELKAQLTELNQKYTKDKTACDSTEKVLEKELNEYKKQVATLSDSLASKTKQLEQKKAELENFQNSTSRMGGRVRMKEPDLSKIQSAEHVTICLKLLVDENGTVVEAINDVKRTTSKDAALIDQVIKLVKKDLRYSRDPGASLLQSNFTIKIGPKN